MYNEGVVICLWWCGELSFESLYVESWFVIVIEDRLVEFGECEGRNCYFVLFGVI